MKNSFNSTLKTLLLFFSVTTCASFADSQNDYLRSVTDTYRSNPARMQAFKAQENGTVIDTRTNLEWMRCSLGQKWTGKSCEGEAQKLTWHDALVYKHTFAGHSDWHLPNRYELDTLIYCSSGKDGGRIDKNHKLYKFSERLLDSVQKCKGKFDKPTILQEIFPNTIAKPYWSSTPTDIKKGMGKDSSWATYFVKGSGSFGIQQTVPRYIRLVRNIKK